MLEPYLGEGAPPQAQTPALKPKLRSWTGRVWRATPQRFQLKLDASLATSDIENTDLSAALTPLAAELSSFPIYLDYACEGQLLFLWAAGVFNIERSKRAFMRFCDFLDTIPAHSLIPLLPAAGAQSDLILSVIPYRLDRDVLVFVITDYDLGFHNRIG
jgi:hypothetical protein